MLIQFSVENFLSYKSKATLSLLPSKDKENTNNVALDKKFKSLKTIAVYGANASGKTSLIKALVAAIMAIRTSNNLQINEKIPNIMPFKFDSETPSEPSKFEFIFINNGIKYLYGFSATPYEVVEEYLYYYLSSKPSLIFDRHNTVEYKFPPGKNKLLNDIAKRNTNNKLFLSTATSWNYEKTKDAFIWFSEYINIFEGYTGFENIVFDRLEKDFDGSLKKFTSKVLKESDTNISDFIYESEPMTPELYATFPKEFLKLINENFGNIPGKQVKITTGHEVFDKNGIAKNFKLELSEESLGTQHLFYLSTILKSAFEKGETIIIDEIDSSLHPLLVNFIIGLFHNPEENKNNAQLIFSTHDTNLLSLDVFRRDQIYFVEKNNRTGESELYSLDEFPVRKTENIRIGYLQGRYGAIPFLGSGAMLWD